MKWRKTMSITEFNQNLKTYRESKHTAANEDRLLDAIKLAPHGINLKITASDHHGAYSSEYEKTDNNWIVKDHWFYQTDTVIPDKMVAHDLTWLLRIRNVQTTVTYNDT